ncbi:MAG: hypothetical protein ACLSFB_16605 [[Clostridium] scindens]
MSENKVTINEMIARMVAEARRLGYSESSIWTNIQPGLRAFAIYYGKRESLSTIPKSQMNMWDSRKRECPETKSRTIITEISDLPQTA